MIWKIGPTLWQDSGRKDWWQRQYVDLSGYSGAQYLRFRLTDDSVDAELTDAAGLSIISGLSPALPLPMMPPPAPPCQPPCYIRISPIPSIPAPISLLHWHSLIMFKLEIFNIKGQKVATLADEAFPASSHTMVWNGKGCGSKPRLQRCISISSQHVCEYSYAQDDADEIALNLVLRTQTRGRCRC